MTPFLLDATSLTVSIEQHQFSAFQFLAQGLGSVEEP